MRRGAVYRTIHSDIGQETNMPEQLIIRVGKGCNFRCIFCNVAENESVLSKKSSIKEILALTLYKLKYSKIIGNAINVTISGGEPSIFPQETLFILKYFAQYFLKRSIRPLFDIQSNASNIDEGFACKLKELGVGQALISSHAHDAAVFESIIGVSYATMGPKFERGVRALLDVGIPVTFNIVLNNLNKDHYIDHLEYLMRMYPEVELYNIGFVQPHGMAQENFQRLFVQYAKVKDVYNRAISLIKSRAKKVHSHLVGLPLCFLDDWGNSMEYMYNKGLILVQERHTLIQSINDSNKIHTSSCDCCRAKRVCSGVWKEYADIQVLRPYSYTLVSGDTEFHTTYNLGKLYDGGCRIFMLDARVTPLIEIQNKVNIIKSYGYAWTSIVINEDIIPDILNDLRIYAGMNIQWVSKDVSLYLGFIQAVYEYNEKHIFQKRIQLDICVRGGSKESLSSVIKYFTGDIHIHLPRSWKRHGIMTHSSIHYYLGDLGR